MTSSSLADASHMLVLCAGGDGRASRAFGGPLPPLPDGETYVGFPEASGDPEFVVLHGLRPLHGDTWSIVRVDVGAIAERIVEIVANDRETLVAIKFVTGHVMFHGKPLEALAALQAYRDDRTETAIRLFAPNMFGLADAKAFSVAMACGSGIARAGDYSHADGGIVAIAGNRGHATPGKECFGQPPLAVIGAEGVATVSENGIAMARGPQADITTGDFGRVFAPFAGAAIRAGAHSEVVARRPHRISTGTRSMVVAHGPLEETFRINVGEGTLVVVHGDGGDGGGGTARGIVAQTGENGLVAGEWCKIENGRFVPSDVTWKSDRPSDPDWPVAFLPIETLADHLLARRPPADRTTDELTFEELTLREYIGKHAASGARFVLCMGLGKNDGWPQHGIPATGESVVCPNWDPKSQSVFDGFRGLLDGIGDPRTIFMRSAYGDYWYLVSVDEFVPVPPISPSGHPAAVRFERGTIVASGGVACVLDMLAMISPHAERRVGELCVGPTDACLKVPSYGAAIVGHRGFAAAGHYSEAVAGDDGIAIVGSEGSATAGHRGIAIADEGGAATTLDLGVSLSLLKRFGDARANDRGFAIGIGRYKCAFAGDHGCATTSSWQAHAGNNATAIATDGDARVGEFGVAIGKTVAGRMNARLVALAEGDAAAATAIVGQQGIEPNISYLCRDGKLVMA